MEFSAEVIAEMPEEPPKEPKGKFYYFKNNLIERDIE